jgi:hypothetical protein
MQTLKKQKFVKVKSYHRVQRRVVGCHEYYAAVFVPAHIRSTPALLHRVTRRVAVANRDALTAVVRPWFSGNHVTILEATS